MSNLKFMIRSVLILILLILLKIPSQTVIPGGAVHGNWTADSSPYLINGDIEIPKDSILIIEPGVLIAFNDTYGLNVKGRLLAIGTETDSIYFTKNDTTGFSDTTIAGGGWKGIKFIDTSVENDTSKIQYCRFEYAKAFGEVWFLNAGGAITAVNFDKIIISNSTFTNNIATGPEDEVPSGGAIHLAWSDIKIFDNTFKNNRSLNGGAIQIHESSPIFRGNLFTNNRARDGGAIVLGGDCQISFDGDQFINNVAENFSGGVICWAPSATTWNNVKFIGNKGRWAGGLGIVEAEAFINNSTFNSNTANDWGGGIAVDFGKIDIKSSVFVNDSSAWGSGGIHLWYTDAQISQTSFIDNNAEFGSALHSGYSTINIDSSEFIGNYANNGGAMHHENSSLYIDSCLFEGNNALNDGGAMQYFADTLNYIEPLFLEINNSRFTGNTAFRRAALEIQQLNSDESLVDIKIDSCLFSENVVDRGGNVSITGFVKNFKISNSMFSKNEAALRTAGLNLADNVNGKIERTIFCDNFAGGGGSAVSVGLDSYVKFINTTFVNNSGESGAPITGRVAADIIMLNSIVWGNTPANFVLTSGNDSTPCNLQIYYSDIEFGTDSILINDSVSTLYFDESNIVSDPMFLDPASEDFNLDGVSPCIDSGVDFFVWDGDTLINKSENDYYGNGIDMGAIEFIPSMGYENDDPLTKQFSLLQNYPNPFNPQTTIEFSIPDSRQGRQAQFAVIKIFDMLGRELKTLLSENVLPGYYQIEFSAGDLSSGVYFYQLTAGSFRQTKKMILLK